MNLFFSPITSNLNSKKIFFLNLITVFLFVIDRAAKKIFFTIGGEYFVLGQWLKLKLTLNPGLAFGIGFNFYALVIIYFLIIIFLVWFLIGAWRKGGLSVVFYLGLIIAGAFSNLLDRLYIGQVIDYIDVRYFSVFNLADMMIVLGVFGILLKNTGKPQPAKVENIENNQPAN